MRGRAAGNDVIFPVSLLLLEKEGEMSERVEVVIIGGGQAELAMSYYLTQQGRPHVVLEQSRVGETWCLGLHHGRFCLGCCWVLMLVMFGVCIGNLTGMAARTGAMVIEKTVPGGKQLSPLIGIILLLLGVLCPA